MKHTILIVIITVFGIILSENSFLYCKVIDPKLYNDNKFKDSEPGDSRLVKAIINSDIVVINEEISKGIDLNNFTDERESYLTIAVYQNNLEIIKLLLQNKADPNKYKIFPPLLIASIYGELKIVQAILEAGANINENTLNGLPITAAIDGNNMDVVKYLVENGVGLNIHEKSTDLTALHVAVMRGHEDIVEYLLSIPNIDVNSTTKAGTPAYDLTFQEESPICFWRDRNKALRLRKLFESHPEFDKSVPRCRDVLIDGNIKEVCGPYIELKNEAIGK